MNLFIEGADLSGKDTIINLIRKYVPINVYYVSGKTFFDYPEDERKHNWKISYQVILDSINPEEFNIIYRTPFTNYIYQKINNQLFYDFEDYIKFMKQFNDVEIMLIDPPEKEIWERYKKRKDKYINFSKEYLTTVVKEYRKTFKLLEKHYNFRIVPGYKFENIINIMKDVWSISLVTPIITDVSAFDMTKLFLIPKIDLIFQFENIIFSKILSLGILLKELTPKKLTFLTKDINVAKKFINLALFHNYFIDLYKKIPSGYSIEIRK